jgi:microcystin-dependent protein
VSTTSPLVGPSDTDSLLIRLQDRVNALEQTATLPPGIIAYCATAVPDGWLVCDGSTISATRYGQLVAKLGGTTLPNLRGRVVVGQSVGGTFPTLLGTGGVETVTLTGAQSGMPSHTHDTTIGGRGDNPSAPSGGVAGYLWGDTGGRITAAAGPVTASSSHSNLQPYVVLLPIIKF